MYNETLSPSIKFPYNRKSTEFVCVASIPDRKPTIYYGETQVKTYDWHKPAQHHRCRVATTLGF